MKYSIEVDEGYVSLLEVLIEALNQAQFGKGKRRHGKDGLPFTRQKIINIPNSMDDPKSFGLIFQACKKLQEGQRLSKDARIRERYGAIIYIAASILRALNGEEYDNQSSD